MSETHERILLTPKNIYRLLTSRNFSVNKWRILPIKRAGGMTLNRFYHDILFHIVTGDLLATIFPEGAYIRATTNFMNRTGVAGAQFVALRETLLDRDAFCRLVDAYEAFLAQSDCDEAVLQLLLKQFETDIAGDDPCVDRSIRDFFLSLRANGRPGNSFTGYRDAVRLAWLTVHAFFGQEMGDERLRRFRDMPEMGMSALLMSRVQRMGQLEYLTVGGCLLQSRALPDHAYMSDERLTPTMLARLIREHGKVALCGLPGSGRGELVRQMLASGDRRAWKRVACVRFENNLATSFRIAFGGMPELSDDDYLSRARQLIGTELLLISCDGCSADQLRQVSELSEWACDVLAVCDTPPDGFHSVYMEMCTRDNGVAIFSRSAGRKGKRDLAAIGSLVTLLDGRPGLIRILGNYSRHKRVTPPRLVQMLTENGLPKLLRDEMKKLSGGTNLIGLLAALPEGDWDIRELYPFFRDMFSTQEQFVEAATSGMMNWACSGDHCIRINRSMIREIFGDTSCKLQDLPLLSGELERHLQAGTRVDDPYRSSDQIMLNLLCTAVLPPGKIFDWLLRGMRLAAGMDRTDILGKLVTRTEAITGLSDWEESCFLVMRAYGRVMSGDIQGGLDALNRCCELNTSKALPDLQFAVKTAYLCEDYALARKLLDLEKRKELSGPEELRLLQAEASWQQERREMESSLETLRAVEEQLEMLGLQGTRDEANLYYMRAQACSFLAGRQQEALGYIDRCEKLLEELDGDRISLLRIRLQGIRGVMLYSQGQAEACIPVFEWVTTQFLRYAGKNANYLRYMHNLCVALTASGHLDEAQQKTEQLLCDLREMHGENNSRYAEALGILCCIRIRLGDLEQALATARGALEILTACGSDVTVRAYRMLLMLLLQKTGQDDEAARLETELQQDAVDHGWDFEKLREKQRKMYCL